MPDSETPDWAKQAEQGAAAAGEPAQAETAAREAQGRYLALINAIDQGFCTIEVKFDDENRPVDYRFLEVNPSFERQTGIDNAAGRWMREIAPDQDQFWFDTYGRVALTGEAERFESSSTPLDRWWSVYAFKIEGPARIAVLFNDISERKRAEAAIRTSQEQFEALLNQAPLGVYLVDADFVIRQVNPVALPVFGDIAGGPVGRDFDEVIHILWDKKYADEVVRIFRHTLETGEPYVTPERAEYRADRDIIEYYEWRLDRIPLPGAKDGVVCYFRDISPQVNARKEIEEGHELARENGERYRTLFEAIDSGFCILEMIFGEGGRATDYRFVEANPAFERQSGLVDAVGRRIREFAPDLEEHWFERYGRVALTGEPLHIEGEAAQLGRWFDINAFRVGAPEQRRVAVLFADTTKRHKAENDSRESEERQAFLLQLSDALRAEPSAEAITNRALRMFSEQMGLDRCYVGIYRLAQDIAEFPHQVHDDCLAPLPAEIRLSDFPEALKIAFDRTLVIDNVAEEEGFSDSDRANIGAFGLQAFVAATLRKGKNNPLWAIVAGSMHPRAWTQSEVSLVEEVAERTWAAVERARAEAATREAQAQCQALFAASPVPFMVLAPNAPDFTITGANDAYFAATLTTRESLVGRSLFDVFPDDPSRPGQLGSEALAISLDRVLKTRTTDAMERVRYDLVLPDGGFEPHWWEATNAPMLDASGEVSAIIHQVTRVTELHYGEEAEREDQERQAFLLKLSDALTSLSDPADIQAATARLVAGQLGVGWCYFNEFDDRGTHATVLGDFHRDGLPSMVGVHDLSGERDFLDLMSSEAMLDTPDLTSSELLSAQGKAAYGALGIRSALGAPLLRSGRLAAVILVADTSVRRWAPGDAELLRGVAERTWAAIQRARVEAALRDSERHQRLLLAELQHRVRNILTMVRSVARRTAENAEDVDDYVRHLDGRLAALARVQTIVTREPDGGVNLHDMVLDELVSQAAVPAQYEIEGPEVELSPKAAEVLSLAVHELTTNSTKYGVLSESSGTIRIGWAVEDRDGRAWLRWTWREPVGAAVDRPARSGFGTELIRQRVPYELHGTGEIRIGDDEVEARIDFPLAHGQSKLENVASDRDIGQ